MSLSKFILPAITLILGLVLGFFVNELVLPASLIPQEATQKVPTTSTTEGDLPISLELLQNPITYEWRGSIEGTVVDKDEHVFVLQDERGSRITITDLLSTGEVYNPHFYRTTSAGELEELLLNEIPIGTKLRGEFWIFKGGEDRPVGGSFQIIE